MAAFVAVILFSAMTFAGEGNGNDANSKVNSPVITGAKLEFYKTTFLKAFKKLGVPCQGQSIPIPFTWPEGRFRQVWLKAEPLLTLQKSQSLTMTETNLPVFIFQYLIPQTEMDQVFITTAADHKTILKASVEIDMLDYEQDPVILDNGGMDIVTMGATNCQSL